MKRCIVDSPVSVAVGGIGYTLSRFMPDVEDNDPLVKAAPWAFADADESPVERSTARPGEKRQTRRPAKKSAE